MRATLAKDNRAAGVQQNVPGRHLKLQNPIRTSCPTALKRTVTSNCNFRKESYT
jgi:hypothetical protein